MPNFIANVFQGTVVDVNKAEHKVIVDFSGTVKQMEPDEIRLIPQQVRPNLEAARRGNNKLAERTASLVRAIYHVDLGRKYKRTRSEADGGIVNCPTCHGEMGREKYMRGVGMYRCPGCGFKIRNDEIMDKDYKRVKVEVELGDEPEVEVEIEPVAAGTKESMRAKEARVFKALARKIKKVKKQ